MKTVKFTIIILLIAYMVCCLLLLASTSFKHTAETLTFLIVTGFMAAPSIAIALLNSTEKK